MRPLIIVLSASLLIAGMATGFAADDLTQDECVKQFLEQATKDWKGYDNCRRGATQLKLRDINGQANRNMMLPPANTQPAPAGTGSGTDTNVR